MLHPPAQPSPSLRCRCIHQLPTKPSKRTATHTTSALVATNKNAKTDLLELFTTGDKSSQHQVIGNEHSTKMYLDNLLSRSEHRREIIDAAQQAYVERYSGEGDKTEQDLIDFRQNGVFSRRSLDEVQLCVAYAVLTHHGMRFSDVTAHLPAAKCQDWNKLLSQARWEWPKVLDDVDLLVPPGGVQARYVSIEVKESYGEYTSMFHNMPSQTRYAEWFEKNVYCGRAPNLYVRLTYDVV